MRSKFRSIYADLYVKGSHRSRYVPRLDRPWRPRVLAWAGPTAFNRNRFYEMDHWYKARIDKPAIIPKLHIIDPDKYLHSLEERLGNVEQPKTNIGFKERQKDDLKQVLPKEDLEKLARNLKLQIDIKQLDHRSLDIFHHYGIFNDLFNAPVFFNIVQQMTLSYGANEVYHGNVLYAADTMSEPSVMIESTGSGYTTLLALNIDGNPYSNEQLLHWFVANIKDGETISTADQIVPYLQAVPFKGTGFHRFVFVLFHHQQSIDFGDYRLKSMQHFYKKNETSLTPSSIAFSQVLWDLSVNKLFHSLGMKAPIYEYEYRPPLKMMQKEFPNKAQPFDLYLDQFRDPTEVESELLKRRLRMSRIAQRPQQPKYPDMNYSENKKKLPAWQHARLIKENSGTGKNFALWNNPID
ncbi:unnamed protein product [Anisakis simplex]|uniref:Large ribosomal subunit protein mL38 n=1 Tax=Anisakis simplex TaxID=6269 RepID=A0A0M3JWU2_ANISI|nr:unnamed protein product [Anisakis simplex]